MILTMTLLSLTIPALGVLTSVIGLWRNPVNWKRYLPLLVIGFFAGAYAFVPPDDGYDLYRYLPLVEQYGNLSFIEALNMDGDILYASHILFWICGKLHLPHLAPALTTACVYWAAFYMTCDTAERYGHLQYIAPVIIFQAAMMPYIMIINNVRNVFGLVMVALAAYLDIVKKNRKWYVYALYAIGSMFHLSALAFVAFRLLCRIAKKLFGLIVVLPFFFTSIIYFLNANIDKLPLQGSFGTSIKGIVWRMYGYLTYRDVAYAVTSLNSRTVMLDRIVMLIGMTMSIVIIYYFLRRGKQYAKDDDRVYTLVGMIAALTIACNAFAMPNFWRFSAAFYAISGVVAIPLLASYWKMPLLIKVEPFVFMAMAAFCLVFQYYRYDRAFIIEWLGSGLATNWVTLVVDFFQLR